MLKIILNLKSGSKDILEFLKAFNDEKANKLARAFNENFLQFSDHANDEILNAAPKII